MASLRYFIEQEPDRFYADLARVKDRARKLSKATDDGVYVLAKFGDGDPIGSIAYYGGRQDAREGIFA